MKKLISVFLLAVGMSFATYAQDEIKKEVVEKQDQEQVVKEAVVERPFVRRQYQRRDLSCSPNFVCDSIPKGTGYKATGVRRPYNEGRTFYRAPRYNQDRVYRNRR